MPKYNVARRWAAVRRCRVVLLIERPAQDKVEMNREVRDADCWHALSQRLRTPATTEYQGVMEVAGLIRLKWLLDV